MKTFYGIKHQMKQTWSKAGKRISVTEIKAEPVQVIQVKTKDADGYQALQVGIGNRSPKNLSQPVQGHLKKAGKNINPMQVREMRLSSDTDIAYQPGDSIKLSDIVSLGDIVAVSSQSKGRGFTGVIKRWGFAGGPRTHGQSDRLRAPGSIGQGTDPGRVHKGKKMAGRSGNQTTKVKNLRVVHIDEAQNLIWVSGPVPGANGSLVELELLESRDDFEGLHDIEPVAAASDSAPQEANDTNTQAEKAEEDVAAANVEPEEKTKNTEPETKD